jgi:hypothetical protein
MGQILKVAPVPQKDELSSQYTDFKAYFKNY